VPRVEPRHKGTQIVGAGWLCAISKDLISPAASHIVTPQRVATDETRCTPPSSAHRSGEFDSRWPRLRDAPSCRPCVGTSGSRLTVLDAGSSATFGFGRVVERSRFSFPETREHEPVRARKYGCRACPCHTPGTFLFDTFVNSLLARRDRGRGRGTPASMAPRVLATTVALSVAVEMLRSALASATAIVLVAVASTGGEVDRDAAAPFARSGAAIFVPLGLLVCGGRVAALAQRASCSSNSQTHEMAKAVLMVSFGDQSCTGIPSTTCHHSSGPSPPARDVALLEMLMADGAERRRSLELLVFVLRGSEGALSRERHTRVEWLLVWLRCVRALVC